MNEEKIKNILMDEDLLFCRDCDTLITNQGYEKTQIGEIVEYTCPICDTNDIYWCSTNFMPKLTIKDE